MLTSIAGRSVIVTGASKGIGKGIAKVFCQNGGKVLVVSRNFEEAEACAMGRDEVHGSRPGVLPAKRAAPPRAEPSAARVPGHLLTKLVARADERRNGLTAKTRTVYAFSADGPA
jgi:NAD(P)-dependent dehydrogenase (short-subunit alcohol dehydrogenase family)